MPELGLEKWLLAYVIDRLVEGCRKQSPDFQGRVGMAFLRQVAYGGNGDEFWIAPLPPASPS